MEELIKKFPNIDCDYPLSKLTTLQIGGNANYFIEITFEDQLVELMNFVYKHQIKHYILGEGSNIVAPDQGYNGLIIKIKIQDLEIKDQIALVGAGMNLLEFIQQLNTQGLSGLEKMAGIPGTVGGAIYGNAGAYGQETKDHLVSIRYYNGEKVVEEEAINLGLGYRTSNFKQHKDWLIISAKFQLEPADPQILQQTSEDTIKLREQRYPPHLKYPGSYFKNVILEKLPQDQQQKLLQLVPSEKIVYGKIPAGYLLEQIGAKGQFQGGIHVTDHHANLLYNDGTGTAADMKTLANRLKQSVLDKFGISLEEEVQYLD